jgi:hypothetical protein
VFQQSVTYAIPANSIPNGTKRKSPYEAEVNAIPGQVGTLPIPLYLHLYSLLERRCFLFSIGLLLVVLSSFNRRRLSVQLFRRPIGSRDWLHILTCYHTVLVEQ